MMDAQKKRPCRVDVWHNILWSKYKGGVFSSLYARADKSLFDIRFIQIAETEGNRVALGGVDLSYHQYPYELLFKGSLDHVGLAKRLWAALRKSWTTDADLVVLTGYETAPAWVQLACLKLRGKKVGVFCDSTIYDQKQKFWRGILKRIFFTSVDVIFGYGLRSKEYVLYYGANPSNVFQRCQAAALPDDYDPVRALADRVAMAAKPEAPRFLYVGRLSPEKDLPVLLRSFADLKKGISAASLVLVGQGPQKDELVGFAAQLGITDSVNFVGSKSGPDLFREYAKATCFVLPSRSEPWGLVVNEALAYGCPAVVSKNCGCVPELIVEGCTGYIFATGDAHNLTRCMRNVLVNFRDVEQTSKTCIAHIAAYSPDAAAEQILAGIRNTLKCEE